MTSYNYNFFQSKTNCISWGLFWPWAPACGAHKCRTIVLQILQYHASFEQISLFAGISMPLMIFSLIDPTFFVFAPAAAPVCSATALGLCLFCVIVCCRLGSLESVAMVPIGRECPPSILFSHLLPKLLISVRIRASVRSFRRTHTHITCTHTTSIFVHACFFSFLNPALQQGFACMSGKSGSCC